MGVPFLEIPMNLNNGTKSIFLSKENKEKPETQLAEILLKKENADLRKAILGDLKDPIEAKMLAELCRKFLTENLFVPGYYQHNPVVLINMMNVIIQSSLSQTFNSIFLFTNNLDINKIQFAIRNGFLSSKIKKIVFKTKEGTTEIFNPNGDPNSKLITLAHNYPLEDNSDYNNIFHCAQFFAGCSGDKTFEKVLSNDLIPFFTPHNNVKSYFIQDAILFNNLFSLIDKLIFLNNILSATLAKHRSLGQILQIIEEHLKIPKHEWSELLVKIYNTLQTGQAFEHNGERYELTPYSELDKSMMAFNFWLEVSQKTKKEYTSETKKIFIEKFMFAANHPDPKTLKDFLESCEINMHKDLVEMANTISQAYRNNKSFEIRETFYTCEFNRSDERTLIDLSDQDLRKIVKKHLDAQLSAISQNLNLSFFAEWKKMCQQLQNEHNLHHELPVIVNHFFAKYLQDLSDNKKKTLAKDEKEAAAKTTKTKIEHQIESSPTLLTVFTQTKSAEMDTKNTERFKASKIHEIDLAIEELDHQIKEYENPEKKASKELIDTFFELKKLANLAKTIIQKETDLDAVSKHADWLNYQKALYATQSLCKKEFSSSDSTPKY